ncbi:MAG TPA: cyclopropane-fatty-acyl-phospholipid synthase family protein [Planctomycetota bacterium]|nr:cyclopropane-fatty-acyl-phospholipid synthase family protein [Planctomycetota bacterium]
MSLSLYLAERGLLPDAWIRFGIRKFDHSRLEREQGRASEFPAFIEKLRASPLALDVHKANEQHYELPPAFFQRVLGEHLKYSSCYFPNGKESLDEGEAKSLELSCEHAQLEDGQNVLELGCGWGSLSLWMAERFPHSRIFAVSNSKPQREFIEAACAARGLFNLKIVTCDINAFDPFVLAPEFAATRFDRVVSIEMFEHLRNYELLLEKIASWLRPGGKLFAHIFCHRRYAYLFEAASDDDWMGRYFFTAGMMPSENLLPHFQRDLTLEEQWWWNGRHYGRTSELWLLNQDARHAEILPIMAQIYGQKNARLWHQRWRIFFIACAELFNFRGGEEWGVAHYRFVK